MKKLIRYRLSVSQVFPKTHPKARQQTGFIRKIRNGVLTGCWGCTKMGILGCGMECRSKSNDFKIHTIRANYPLWQKRIEKVQKGEAVIELCHWEDKPYRSKQVVFATLDKNSGCGIQQIGFLRQDVKTPVLYLYNDRGINEKRINAFDLCRNDGLSIEDFESWFKGYDLSKSMGVIHFTKFRY